MTKLPANHVVTLAPASGAMLALEVQAERLGIAQAISVINARGDLLAFARMDGNHIGNLDVSIAKDPNGDPV